MKTAVILTFTFPPNADGVAEAAKAMAVGLAERGWRVVVGTGHLAKRSDFTPWNNVEVRQFKVSGSPNLRVGIQGETREFKNFLMESDPDVLICHCWDMWPTTLAQKVFGRLRAKKVLVSHGYTTHLWQKGPRFPWGFGYWAAAQYLSAQLPWTMRLYDRVVVLSPTPDCNRFFDHFVARMTGYRGLRVIPNGTEPEAIRAAPTDFRQRHGLPEGFLFLSVANYSARKNQEMALRAFRKLVSAPATLCFIGSEFNEYSKHVKTLDVAENRGDTPNKVVFLEKLLRADILSAYASCDAFVLSAHAETQPIVLLESMAAGKPFISTDTGCVRDLPGGLVVQDVAEMTAAMASLISDNPMRTRLGAAGGAAVDATYTWEKVMDAHHEMLLELVGSAAS